MGIGARLQKLSDVRTAGRRFPPEADQPVAEASVSIPILNNKHFDKTTGIGAIG